MSDTSARPADPVATFYDRLTDLIAAAYDGNFHLGYSPEPGDTASLELEAYSRGSTSLSCRR
ncbi:hypothetical protein OG906_40535 (plasmid) [Streptomyces sp. NBC_01426]|uniref:hypothetical protein n=1 Tax=Streptomyces sp. NBC_01426 TaxID=2975866 RepID=UPI002E37DC26|nr:hypothetical protein [Streptomyces sp. NBC_01426]